MDLVAEIHNAQFESFQFLQDRHKFWDQQLHNYQFWILERWF